MMLFSVITFFLAFLTVWPIFAQDQDDTDSPETIEYIVSANASVNLRTGPGTYNPIADTAEPGETLLVYDEEPEVSGWLRIYRQDEDDAYIADFLVEQAPQRFYNPAQSPIVVLEGRGHQVTDIIELPEGAYRLDATVSDNAFIFESIVIEGSCRDDILLNELDFNISVLTLSTVMVSTGCSLIFETDNVDGNWRVEVRDLLDEDFFADTLLPVEEEGTSISARGHQLTMPTVLSDGVWTINARVQDRAFILQPHVLLGDCSSSPVFNEFADEPLELSSVYRVDGGADGICVIYWETSNVEGEWEISFEQLR